MNKSFKLILALFFLILSVGCGKQNSIQKGSSRSISRATPKPNPVNIPLKKDEDTSLKIFKTKVNCLGKKCNPAVAMMITSDASFMSACTASLIEEDVMITNSHCIPEDLKEVGKKFQQRIFLFFPKTKEYESEKVEADYLLSFTVLEKSKTLLPDLALFRLKTPVKRRVLKISRQGLKDNQKVSIQKINPTVLNKAYYKGESERTNCKAIFSSALNLDFYHRLAPVVTLGDCEILHGNSGSPILNEKDEIVGVVHGTLDREKAKEQILETKLLDSDIAFLGLGTNLACSEMNEVTGAEIRVAGAINKKCSWLAEKISNEDRISKKVQKIFNNDSGNSELDKIFKFKTIILESSKTVNIPDCFKRNVNLNFFKDSTGQLKTEMETHFQLKLQGVEIGLNKYLQLDVKKVASQNETTFINEDLRFSPSEFLKSKQSIVKLDGQMNLVDEVLKTCAE